MQRTFLAAFGLTVLGIFTLLVSADSPQSSSAQNAHRIPRELLEQRLTSARQVFEQDLKRTQVGEMAIDDHLMRWSERWLEAQLALTENPKERTSALEAHVKRLKDVEKMYQAWITAGQARASDGHAAAYYRAEAEIRLLEAGTK